MANRQRIIDKADRRATRLVHEFASELREGRLTIGVRQADVGKSVGVSQSQVSHAERARLDTLTIPLATRLAAVVGLDLSVRCFPAQGGALRDVAHQQLISRLKSRVSASYVWELETPVGDRNDRRAFDVTLRIGSSRIGLEAETRLRDLQALLRRLALKRNVAPVDRPVLVVAATRTNRRVVTEPGAYLRTAFPLTTKQTMRALSPVRFRAPTGSR